MILDYEDVLDILNGTSEIYGEERLPVAVVVQGELHKPGDPDRDGVAVPMGVEWRCWEVHGWGPVMDDDPELREFIVAQAIAGTSELIERGEV